MFSSSIILSIFLLLFYLISLVHTLDYWVKSYCEGIILWIEVGVFDFEISEKFYLTSSVLKSELSSSKIISQEFLLFCPYYECAPIINPYSNPIPRASFPFNFKLIPIAYCSLISFFNTEFIPLNSVY